MEICIYHFMKERITCSTINKVEFIKPSTSIKSYNPYYEDLIN